MVPAALYQELGIPFTCVGMAEKNADFQEFLRLNFQPSHLHATIADQTQDAPCLLHPYGETCECSSECGSQGSPDLACLGTPCPPFSRARPKRFCDGSVKGHSDYSTTFAGAVAFLTKYEPRVCIVEQVDGFGNPFSASDSECPKDRQVCPGRG